jgi:hypothetical protein
MDKSRLLGAVFACFFSSIVVTTVHATSINIDFGDIDTTTPDTYGAIGSIGTWNFITSLGVTSNLVDIFGISTSVGLDLNAGVINGSYCGETSAANANKPLLCDNYYSNNSTWSLDITGLENGEYNLILYAPSNSLVSTGNMTVNGVAVPELIGSWRNVLSDGLSYSVEQVFVSNGQISLTGTTLSSSYSYAGLSGIQISAAVPVPAALLLFGSGLLGLIGIARRKNAA